MSPARFHPLLRLLICAFAVFVAVLAVQAVAFFWLLAPQVVTPGATTPPAPLITPRVVALMALLSAPIAVFVVRLCRRALDRQSLRSLGLDAPRAVPNFLGGALCGTLAITFLFGVLWLTGHVEIGGLSQRAREVGAAGIALRLCLWALAMLCVALTEELLFRGYALHNLGAWLGNDRTGLGAVAIIQGFVFGLVHMMNFGPDASPEKLASAWQALPNLTLIGIFFAFCVFKTGSLWFPIGFHAAWNFLLGSVYSLPVSGNDTFRVFDVEVNGSRWLTGGAFGAEGSILLTILIAAMIYVVRQGADAPDTAHAIAQLWPRDEEDDEPSLSRAPGLRERKEKRRVQATTKPTFEGWNDLAPAERAPRYTAYQPALSTPTTPAEVSTASAEPLTASAEASTLPAEPQTLVPLPQTLPAEPQTMPAEASTTPAEASTNDSSAPTAPPTEQTTPTEPAKPPVKKPAPRW
jgi:uncharacterized protein